MKKILAPVLLLCLFSCKKEETANKTALTKENIVGTWKQTAETQNGINTWNSAFYDECEMDDVVQFKSDDTYQRTDAGQTCASSTNESGSWSLTGTAFVINGQSMSVDSFTGSKLVLKQTETSNGATLTVMATLTKQ